MAISCEKTLLCDRVGCSKQVALRDFENVEDISLLNKARDQKWDQVNGRWLCSDCREGLAAYLRTVDMVIKDGKVVSRNSQESK